MEYRPARTRKVGVIQEHPGWITVYGAVDDRDACREVLKRWLRRRAREALVPWLGRLAEEGGFRFAEAVIRGQKTRWASCSAGGTISLSFKLLFLEREEVRCVLLHELCHTRCMNHSPRFWQLLSRHEPDVQGIHKGMRDGWKRVPAWVEEPPGNETGIRDRPPPMPRPVRHRAGRSSAGCGARIFGAGITRHMRRKPMLTREAISDKALRMRFRGCGLHHGGALRIPAGAPRRAAGGVRLGDPVGPGSDRRDRPANGPPRGESDHRPDRTLLPGGLPPVAGAPLRPLLSRRRPDDREPPGEEGQGLPLLSPGRGDRFQGSLSPPPSAGGGAGGSGDVRQELPLLFPEGGRRRVLGYPHRPGRRSGLRPGRAHPRGRLPRLVPERLHRRLSHRAP